MTFSQFIYQKKIKKIKKNLKFLSDTQFINEIFGPVSACKCPNTLPYPCPNQYQILTLIGVHEYSGQVEATAKAPSIFVWHERPTKNSRPVKSTSEPDKRAVADQRGSTTAWLSSFLKTALMVSTSTWRILAAHFPSREAEGRHIRAIPLITTAKSWVNTEATLVSSGGNSRTSSPRLRTALTTPACWRLASSMWMVVFDYVIKNKLFRQKTKQVRSFEFPLLKGNSAQFSFTWSNCDGIIKCNQI